MEQRFAGKVVLITGGAGGIGRATAARVASEGARVALVDLAGSDLDGSRQAVERAGGEALTVEADVTRSQDVARYVAAAADRFGGLDGFFNNAGILGAVSPLVDYPEDVFDRVMAVNAKGVWLGLRHVAPALRARGGGAVVNTASVAGLRGTRGLIAYTAAKHAVVGITRSAAIELARDQIRVNAICPSPVETAMAREVERGLSPAAPARAQERLAAAIPLRRYARPEEVAGLVAFLLSADAAYLTGGLYTVDGGLMA